jgi:hypothetical protein
MALGDHWPSSMTIEETVGTARVGLGPECFDYGRLATNTNTNINFDADSRGNSPSLLDPRLHGILDVLASAVASNARLQGDTLRVISGYETPPSDASTTTLFHRGLSAKISLTNDQSESKMSMLGLAAIHAGFDSVSFDSYRTLIVSVRSGVCHKAVDLVVLMDSSQAVTSYFDVRIVPFVMQLLEGFTIGTEETHVGLAQYSATDGSDPAKTGVDIVFNLKDHANDASSSGVMRSTFGVQQSGLVANGGVAGSFLTKGLETVRDQMLTAEAGARSQTAQVVVIVSGTAPTDQDLDLQGVADQLEADGVVVIMVAVGELDYIEPYAYQVASTAADVLLVDTFDGLRDRSIDTRVVGRVCETPTPFTPGESVVRSLRTCELETFRSLCVVPQFVVRGKTESSEDAAFELYTALSGIPSAINHLNSAVSAGDVSELIVSSVSSASDTGILFSVVGRVLGMLATATPLAFDAWFDRFSNGYMGETVGAQALRNAVLTGDMIYTVPNDGNREVYSIKSSTTDGTWTVDSTTGVVSVTGDVTVSGIVRVAVEYPTNACLNSFVDVAVENIWVSGYIYIDFDGSGHQNDDDYGVGGIILTLKSRASGLIITTETDSTGHWAIGTTFGMTILSINVDPTALTVTEGFSNYMLSVTATDSRFPTLGLQPIITTTTTPLVTRPPVAVTTAPPVVVTTVPPVVPTSNSPPAPPSPPAVQPDILGWMKSLGLDLTEAPPQAEPREDAAVTKAPVETYITESSATEADMVDINWSADVGLEDVVERPGNLNTTFVTKAPRVPESSTATTSSTTTIAGHEVAPVPWIHHKGYDTPAPWVHGDPVTKPVAEQKEPHVVAEHTHADAPIPWTHHIGKEQPKPWVHRVHDLDGEKLRVGHGKKGGKGKAAKETKHTDHETHDYSKKGSKADAITFVAKSAKVRQQLGKTSRSERYMSQVPGLVALMVAAVVVAGAGRKWKSQIRSFFNRSEAEGVAVPLTPDRAYGDRSVANLANVPGGFWSRLASKANPKAAASPDVGHYSLPNDDEEVKEPTPTRRTVGKNTQTIPHTPKMNAEENEY